jgi:AbrB family looped-hinge helix DNA binding protein
MVYLQSKLLNINYVLILKGVVINTQNGSKLTQFVASIFHQRLKMEVSITTLSENGQVVIPAEVRRDANIKPSTKFLVFNEGGNIMLKAIKKEVLVRDLHLVEAIGRSEKAIKKGKVVKADTSMDDEEIDDLLMR